MVTRITSQDDIDIPFAEETLDVVYEAVQRSYQLHGDDGVLGLVCHQDGLLGYAGVLQDGILTHAYPLSSESSIYIETSPVYPDILTTTTTDADYYFTLDSEATVETESLVTVQLGGEQFNYFYDESYSLPHRERAYQTLRPALTISKVSIPLGSQVVFNQSEYVVETVSERSVTLAGNDETRRVPRSTFLHYLVNTGDVVPPLRSEQ